MNKLEEEKFVAHICDYLDRSIEDMVGVESLCQQANLCGASKGRSKHMSKPGKFGLKLQ